jgi:transcriptional regulator GlxA family with amidase domain
MTERPNRRTLGVLLFPGFELLDVFGPLEAFGMRSAKEYFDVVLVAERCGAVESAQGPRAVAEIGLDDPRRLDLILVPGGQGTRVEVDNPKILEWIRRRGAEAELVLSVCTGAALLARAGVLDGRRATSNKLALRWVSEQGPRVQWVREARWVEDGNVFTSSGVSAGVDMALAVVAKLVSAEFAEHLAVWMEYDWHRDPSPVKPAARGLSRGAARRAAPARRGRGRGSLPGCGGLPRGPRRDRRRR